MDFLLEIADFVVKAAIIVIAMTLVIAVISNVAQRQKRQEGELQIRDLAEELRSGARHLSLKMLSKKQRKQQQKQHKKEAKKQEPSAQARIFVIDFKGSMDAHEVENLQREINAIIGAAKAGDTVFVRLESPGGVVHGYGLAAAQLQRLRDAELKLIIGVDKVAASGGYMMAAVAEQIVAAPFAIIGSIGVVAQLPNFHRWLKKHDVEFEQVTAGDYKRTLTMFGENTDAGRRKFKEDLEQIHEQFKQHIVDYRPQVDLAKVATGEYWTAQQAIGFDLVDELCTTDSWLLQRSKDHDIYQVRYQSKRPIGERIGKNVSAVLMSIREFLTKS
ncbi:putative protease SohB [Pseudidiomarina piscicola]|uniref:Putative protease SohB n=1 Tax=Pseudidiomarina piscicola TaxID=2614830 RepID=A0A6Y9WJH0_9GAMM|nr:protease SohB [Pseudidiomarina piscicola]CAB0149511.1 putative protease SohB [Pseudidiomarina piscicola]VZT38956.1 putative protease SohB [Pseudomonas aeruginosa]